MEKNFRKRNSLIILSIVGMAVFPYIAIKLNAMYSLSIWIIPFLSLIFIVIISFWVLKRIFNAK